MKKTLILLSLLVLTLFVVSCTSVEEKQAAGDLTATEKAEVEPKTGALAGKAIDFGGCTDPDSTATFDKNSLTIKSKTTYASNSFEDKCYTWYKETPKEKTKLIEGTCKNKKFLYWYATCEDYLGKFAKCAEGKCVQPVMCGNITPVIYCVGTNLITKTKDTCTGKVTLSYSSNTPQCNPNYENTISGWGGGLSLVLGQKCENNLLVINDATKIDCSQEQGWLNKKTCAVFTGEEVGFGTELLEFGNSICKEPCTPGQTITTCEDNEYYQLVCNENGLGWTGEDEVGSCPNGLSCILNEKSSGICK